MQDEPASAPPRLLGEPGQRRIAEMEREVPGRSKEEGVGALPSGRPPPRSRAAHPRRSWASILRRPASSTSGRSELSSSAARAPRRVTSARPSAAAGFCPRGSCSTTNSAPLGTGEAPRPPRTRTRRVSVRRRARRRARAPLSSERARSAGRGFHGRRQTAFGRAEILDEHDDPQWRHRVQVPPSVASETSTW